MITSDYYPDGRKHSLISFKHLSLEGNDCSYLVLFRNEPIAHIFGIGPFWNLCPFDSSEVLVSRRSGSRVELVEQYLAITA